MPEPAAAACQSSSRKVNSARRHIRHTRSIRVRYGRDSPLALQRVSKRVRVRIAAARRERRPLFGHLRIAVSRERQNSNTDERRNQNQDFVGGFHTHSAYPIARQLR